MSGPAGWRLEARCADSLPRLAWYARILRGSRCLELLHGPGVEVRGDRFFEGAWDGDFRGAAFHSALTFTGTGARSIGGSYDRPIARRILEERGVPRAAFGQEKKAAAATNPTR